MAKNNDARTARFGLTNFEFSGTERVAKPDGSSHRALPLSLQHNNVITNVRIHPINEYQEVIQRVNVLKNTDVTCEVVVEITKGPTGKDLSIVTDVVDNLCYILSVARGTKIQWIYLDEYDAVGKRISRAHCARVTRPFCPLPAIPPDVSGREATKNFIERAYGTYVDRKRDWKLNEGTIDAYLEGKAEHQYLQMRGVKLAVAMEMLKSVFLSLPCSHGKKYIVEEERFQALIPDLRKRLLDTLECQKIDKSSREKICSKEKVKALNRRSFKHVIQDICNHIGLKPKPQDIRRFVESRNSLIHTGNFCRSALKEERLSEYYFLVNFLDNLFLRLLNYDGPWVDLEPWAKAAGEPKQVRPVD